MPACAADLVHGATDELGYAAVDKVCSVHDLHATMLHQLGIEHEAFSFSFKFQGLDAKLTGVEGAKVIREIWARRRIGLLLGIAFDPCGPRITGGLGRTGFIPGSYPQLT